MGVQEGTVVFEKEIPSVETILVRMFESNALSVQLSIEDIADRKEIDKMYGAGSSTILNEKIIFYTLNYPDLQGIGFWAIEKANKKVIEYSTGIGHSKVIGEFVSALISLGGKRDTEY